MKKFAIWLAAALLAVTCVGALAACGGDTPATPGESEKPSEQPSDPPPVVTPAYPSWLVESTGATTTVTADAPMTVAAGELKELYTQPKYASNSDMTVAAMEPVTMALQLSEDATEKFKASDQVYIDFPLLTESGVEVDETSGALVGAATTLRFYYYPKYSSFYFVYLNDNNGMLAWLTSDGSNAEATQWAMDLAAGKKVYITYQFKYHFDKDENDRLFKAMYYTLYLGNAKDGGGVTWLDAPTLYSPGSGCYIGGPEAEGGETGSTAKQSNTIWSGHYVYAGYKSAAASVFLSPACDFSLTVSELAFTSEKFA